MPARTVTAAATTEQREQPSYRAFAVRLLRARRLSPSFLRMTFTGPDLDEFGTEGLDQRIKLVLPAACGAKVDPKLFDDPDWYSTWRTMPDDERYPLRTYTIRAVRPAAAEVDVDVVLHGVEPGKTFTRGCGLAELLGCVCKANVGPAVRWCSAARPGDPIVLIGPNALYQGPATGIEWKPPADARSYLLAGDETAVPAICSILESLPQDAQAQAFLEVPTEYDELDVRVPAGVQVHWLPRSRGAGQPDLPPADCAFAEVGDDESSPPVGPPAPHGSLLESALRAGVRRLVESRRTGVDVEDVDLEGQIIWDVPESAAAPEGVYAWVAGEAGTVKTLRRFLVRDVGLDRKAVAFMGYWRAGRAEGS